MHGLLKISRGIVFPLLLLEQSQDAGGEIRDCEMQFRWILPGPRVMQGMLAVGSGEMETFGHSLGAINAQRQAGLSLLLSQLSRGPRAEGFSLSVCVLPSHVHLDTQRRRLISRKASVYSSV